MYHQGLGNPPRCECHSCTQLRHGGMNQLNGAFVGNQALNVGSGAFGGSKFPIVASNKPDDSPETV